MAFIFVRLEIGLHKLTERDTDFRWITTTTEGKIYLLTKLILKV